MLAWCIRMYRLLCLPVLARCVRMYRLLYLFTCACEVCIMCRLLCLPMLAKCVRMCRLLGLPMLSRCVRMCCLLCLPVFAMCRLLCLPMLAMCRLLCLPALAWYVRMCRLLCFIYLCLRCTLARRGIPQQSWPYTVLPLLSDRRHRPLVDKCYQRWCSSNQHQWRVWRERSKSRRLPKNCNLLV